MAIIANVAITDTFDQWRIKTNQLIVRGDETINFSNTIFNESNAKINVVYQQANTGYRQANIAYTQANTGYTQANIAYTQANAAYVRANTANDGLTGKLSLTGGTITGNLIINSANLTMQGGATYVLNLL